MTITSTWLTEGIYSNTCDSGACQLGALLDPQLLHDHITQQQCPERLLFIHICTESCDLFFRMATMIHASVSSGLDNCNVPLFMGLYCKFIEKQKPVHNASPCVLGRVPHRHFGSFIHFLQVSGWS